MIPQQLASLMQAAAQALNAGDDFAAENAFRQIVSVNPRHADAWHMLAVLVIRAGRGQEAIEPALHAHQLDRRNPDYLNTLGIAYGEAQQLDQAVRTFKRSLKERPGRADTHFNLAKTYVKLKDPSEAERSFVRAHHLDPTRPDIANGLAMLHCDQGRYQEAQSLLAQARARTPDDKLLALNYALVAFAVQGPDAAIEELAAFVASHPDSPVVREVLARRLLAEGRFAEGWRQYAWRRGRASAPRSGDVHGRRVLLLPEQGLGDQLFFLRFAPRLRERAAFVAFDCPAKLMPLLEGSKVIDELRIHNSGQAEFDVVLSLGDLPEALQDWSTPAAFRIACGRSTEWRERLERLGPAPYLGVTWRAGLDREAEAEFGRGPETLYKAIAIEPLAAALRAWRGTILILQRLPLPGEIELFCRSLGRQAHDLSALNENLADMAAVLSLIDEYVGVSNTNMHIRAGLGKTARVLVPFPPEFRWMSGGETPWFPGFRVYRQAPGGDWDSSLSALAKEM